MILKSLEFSSGKKSSTSRIENQDIRKHDICAGSESVKRQITEQRRLWHITERTCWTEEALTGHPENLPMFHHSIFVRKRCSESKPCTRHCLRDNVGRQDSQDLTSQNWRPLQLFPSGSRGGDHAKMPITFGMTSRIPPHTPDLAGSPTCGKMTT
jgi:hypothetical protein